MNKALFILMALCLSQLGHAQWVNGSSSTSNYIYRTGNVAIGGSNGSAKLNIIGAVNTTHFFHGTNQDIYLRPGYSTGKVVFDRGYVGIGTSSPSEKLEISGNMYLSQSNPSVYWNGNSLKLKPKADVIPVVSIHGSPSYNSRFDMYDAGDNNVKVRIRTVGISYLTGGNVGIGTTSPGARLEVFGTAGLRVRSTTHADSYMDFKGSEDVSTLNPGATTAASIISGRNNGHLVIDIAANDLHDSFAVRTDQNYDGTVDHIAMVIKADGDMGIGTTDPSERLEVNGNARIVGDIYSKKVKVTANASNWPDYVFESNYSLTPLSQLESFIKTNKHLPEVPAAKEVEANGQDLGDIQATLLKKVEELTLYVIEQNKNQLSMKERLEKLEAENAKLKALLKQE